jgi:hypothetical protein
MEQVGLGDDEKWHGHNRRENKILHFFFKIQQR